MIDFDRDLNPPEPKPERQEPEYDKYRCRQCGIQLPVFVRPWEMEEYCNRCAKLMELNHDSHHIRSGVHQGTVAGHDLPADEATGNG